MHSTLIFAAGAIVGAAVGIFSICDTYYGELRRDLPQGIPRRREGKKSRLPWKIENRREKEDGQQLSVFSFAFLLSLPEKKRDVGKETSMP